MARREEVSTSLVCPGCGTEGTAEWSENENPVHAGGSFDRRLLSVSKGFILGPGMASIGDPEILCEECGKAVPN